LVLFATLTKEEQNDIISMMSVYKVKYLTPYYAE